MHKEIQVDKAKTFTWRFYSNGIQLIPSAAKITISNKNGTVIVDAASGTIDAEGTITYAFSAVLNNTDDINFKAEVKYTVSSVDYYYWELFDVVYTPLTNNVRDEDLFKYVGELRGKIFEDLISTTSTGTTTTAVSTDLKSDKRDWTGGFCEIYISQAITHEALITGYAKSTGTITFTPAYTSAIASGLKVRLRTSYQEFIDEAFNEHVIQDVRGKVEVAAKYIDVNVVRKMTIFKALEIICLGRIEIENDKWALRVAKFEEMYSKQYAKLSNEPADNDLDGDISDTENKEKPNYWARDITR